MRTIPQIREAFLRLTNTANLDDGTARSIKRLVKEMYRRPPTRRAEKEHASLTPSLVRQIKAYARMHPFVSYAVMGRNFGVSIGRISEALVGKRAA